MCKNYCSEELSCDLVETKKTTIEQIEKYDVVILGGGIYATGIAGISFLKKHYERLKNKKIIVFAVGAWETALMQAIGSNFDWTDKEYIKNIVEYVRIK
jgi:menaquinone-dependent protoporphyrinogen IX oxidase